jgi:hypothetical protein
MVNDSRLTLEPGFGPLVESGNGFLKGLRETTSVVGRDEPKLARRMVLARTLSYQSAKSRHWLV